MATQYHKYLNVDVIAFLEERMKSNTESYQSDFELDKKIIARSVNSDRKEDKTLLWMSRPMGTHCHTEHEAFIRDTYAHNTWRFYAEQTRDPIIACAVELTGKKNGVILGDVYELDYRALAAEIAKKSVPAQDVVKTFEDGYVDQVSMERSSYFYYLDLVEQHGPVVGSFTLPTDSQELSFILAQQRSAREKLPLDKDGKTAGKKSLADQIQGAAARAGTVRNNSQGKEQAVGR